jgi:hypothetical protein
MPNSRRPIRSLALEPIEPRRLLAFAAELAADVNATLLAATGISEITEMNGIRGCHDIDGPNLWTSDWTAAGTVMLDTVEVWTRSLPATT